MGDSRYGVDGSDIIRWISEEWLLFARENDANDLGTDSVVGQPLWKFVAGNDTQHLYQLLFAKAREKNIHLSVPFRCDSPEIRKYMRLQIEPADDESLEIAAELIREETRDPVPLLDANQARSSELLTMCSWCMHVSTGEGCWLEVEDAIEQLGLFAETLPGLTHGACPACVDSIVSEEGLDAS